MKFTTIKHDNGHLDIYINQPLDTEELITKAGLNKPQTNNANTPYRSEFPVHVIPNIDMPDTERAKLSKLLQEYVASTDLQLK
jgi:hypothetical protein